MKKLLIFTKNIMSELELQKRLILLGYEVFCSQNIFEVLKNRQSINFLSFFNGIIFSETISNEEIAEFSCTTNLQGLIKFRADAGEVSEEKKLVLEEKGIDGWLDYDMSLKDLRDEVSEVFQKTVTVDNNNRAVITINKTSPNQVKQLINLLSAKEKKVFMILYEANGRSVSRKEILEKIWDEDISNSNLTQLSQIIQRIRFKMEKSGFDGTLLETQWKKGYALSDLFHTKFSPITSLKNYSEVFETID
ncbi:winged helix-turn-helix domain-containing protein [Enterococcus sp. LJL90]